MLITFGSIAMTLHMEVGSLPAPHEPIFARNYTIASGGKGANQAMAATRSGAKVALVGKISDDEMSSNILTKLRREGVMTSGVAQSDLPTATEITISDPSGKALKITAKGANAETSNQQVPDDILNEKSLVLLQTDLDPEENAELLQRAKAGGSKTILNLAPSIDLSKNTLKNIDYLIVNHEEAKKLGVQLGLKVESDALRMAEALAKLGNFHCIITLGAKGAVAVTPDRIGWQASALKLEEIIDHSGADDAYCGTFAACIYAGLSFPRALKRAGIAGSLACTKKGVQDSFPFLDDIEKHVDLVEDPQQVKL